MLFPPRTMWSRSSSSSTFVVFNSITDPKDLCLCEIGLFSLGILFLCHRYECFFVYLNGKLSRAWAWARLVRFVQVELELALSGLFEFRLGWFWMSQVQTFFRSLTQAPAVLKPVHTFVKLSLNNKYSTRLSLITTLHRVHQILIFYPHQLDLHIDLTIITRHHHFLPLECPWQPPPYTAPFQYENKTYKQCLYN